MCPRAGKNIAHITSCIMTEPLKQKSINELFLETYDAHAEGIFKHALLRVSNMETAQDITSETFTKTWEYLTKGNDIQNLKGFLYTVADHLIVDHYHYKTRAPLPLDELIETSAEPNEHALLERADTAVRLNQMRSYIQELPPEYQKIILFRFVDDLSIAEIRKLTGKNSTNIYVIIHRALRMLKIKMKQHHHEPL